jgi:hypothetical protein
MPDNVCPVCDDGQENAISQRWPPEVGSATYAETTVGCDAHRKDGDMAWFIGIGAVLVVAAVVRRVVRGRRTPAFDQKNLENANYARIDQDISNVARNKSPWG